MIRTKKQLKFYITADRIMNGYPQRRTISEIVQSFIWKKEIDYLRVMRKYDYYSCTGNTILKTIFGILFKKLGAKLGFSISYNSIGYGLVIPHYGTIVVGSNNNIGNYAVLHTSTCIAATESKIGDGLYMSPGAKITKKVILGSAVTIGANSVLNKSFEQGQVLLGGMPATLIKKSMPWWERDGKEYIERFNLIEKIKLEYLE